MRHFVLKLTGVVELSQTLLVVGVALHVVCRVTGCHGGAPTDLNLFQTALVRIHVPVTLRQRNGLTFYTLLGSRTGRYCSRIQV